LAILINLARFLVFNMLFKLLKLVFIAALLFVNAWILYLFYAPNNPQHLKYIPKDANLVFSVNTKELSSELAHAALFEKDQFMKLLEKKEGEESFFEGKLDNGLNMLGRMTMVNFQDSISGNSISCFLVDINDVERFTAFLQEQEAEVEVSTENISQCYWNESFVAYNEEVAAISADQGDFVMKALTDLLVAGAKAENEFANGLVGDFHDFSVYSKLNDPEKTLTAFLTDIKLTGDFTEECVEVAVTTTLNHEIETKGNFFNEHKHSTAVPDYLKDGFLNMHFDVNTKKIFSIIIEKTIIGRARSLNRAIFKELSDNLGNKIMIRAEGMKVIPNSDTTGKFDYWPLKNDLGIYIPMVDIVAEVNDNFFIHQVLEHFTGDSLPMEKDGEFYVFKSDFNMNYYFHLDKETLTISHTKKKGINLDEQFEDYSNWIYYDLNKALESLAPEGNIIYQSVITGGAEIMAEGIPFSNMYFYSTGEQNGKAEWKGKIFFKSKENHSLIEFIRYIPDMMGSVL